MSYLLIFLLEVVNFPLLISDHIIPAFDLFFETGDLSLKSLDLLVKINLLLVESAYLLLYSLYNDLINDLITDLITDCSIV